MAGILVADTIQVDSIKTKAGSAQSASNLGLSGGAGKNLIINGAMEVSQRGTSFTSTANNTYTLDRFLWYDTGTGVVDISQSTDTPNGNFKNSLKVDVTTADSSLAAGDLYTIVQNIEGTVSSQLGWGTSDAKNVTVSFWIKSPKTGTHSVAVQNSAQNRSRSEEFTVNSANTWEYKSVTFIGDTSGTWLTTTGLGIRLSFPLASGSTFTQAAGSWGTGNIYASTNQVNCMDDAANNFFITGIQLEVGDVASEFEHKKYSDTLLDCYRYFYKITRTDAYGEFLVLRTYSTTQGTGVMILPVSMRAQPTFTSSTVNTSNFSYGMTVLGFPGTDHTHRLATHNAVGGFTANGAAVVQKANNTDPIFMQYDAEL